MRVLVVEDDAISPASSNARGGAGYEVCATAATGYAEFDGAAPMPRLTKPFGEPEIKGMIDRLFQPQTVITFPQGRKS